MLKRTFIHLNGVGPRREADFWRQGVSTWDDFLSAPRLSGLSWERYRLLQEELRESVRQAADPAYFAARLAAGEHWRLFRAFRPRVGYLDIETTGSYWPGMSVTVVGLYDGSSLQQFVQGRNLQQFPQSLADFDLLVTFNGTQFDLPVLRNYFPDLALPPLHVDLRFLLARLGYRGGLKKIEPRFGIRRPGEVDGMDGYMAVILWERHQRGDRTALELLLQYNREDVVNLEILMEQAFRMQQERLLPGTRFSPEAQRAPGRN
ncbi:MAG: ribonuclease H-like domain-containing protein [Desulfobaccales bacterium]|jgi:hypothetical protein